MPKQINLPDDLVGYLQVIATRRGCDYLRALTKSILLTEEVTKYMDDKGNIKIVVNDKEHVQINMSF